MERSIEWYPFLSLNLDHTINVNQTSNSNLFIHQVSTLFFDQHVVIQMTVNVMDVETVNSLEQPQTQKHGVHLKLVVDFKHI
jgi:hypothetical protein